MPTTAAITLVVVKVLTVVVVLVLVVMHRLVAQPPKKVARPRNEAVPPTQPTPWNLNQSKRVVVEVVVVVVTVMIPSLNRMACNCRIQQH